MPPFLCPTVRKGEAEKGAGAPFLRMDWTWSGKIERWLGREPWPGAIPSPEGAFKARQSRVLLSSIKEKARSKAARAKAVLGEKTGEKQQRLLPCPGLA